MMAAGQLYDPRNIPQSSPASGWTLITDPELDRVHTWARFLGPAPSFEVTVTRHAGEWWDIRVSDHWNDTIHEEQASSGVAAFAKVNIWWHHKQEQIKESAA